MKKGYKIVISIFAVIVIIWGIIFCIDYFRCSNLQMPLFVKANERELAQDGGSGTYYGLGYKVEIKKHLSAEYGVQLEKVEMYMFDKFIVGAIADLHNAVVEDKNDGISNSMPQTYNYFVGTILEETTTYMIVEPNEDEKERQSSDKIKINYGRDHIDYLYGIGRKVVIYYTGFIKETYPAQIDTDNISTDGYRDFVLSVEPSNSKDKTKIINNKDLYKNNSDYDLYYYGLNEVNITTIDNKTIPLVNALKSGKITIDGILQKANKDESNGIIKSETYKDGGTTEWYYDTYTIIKRHSLDGNRDVYIGIPEMRLNNI